MTDVAARRLDPQPHEIADEHRALADAALEILLDSSLEPIVDMVLTRRDGAYEALSADGRVRFTADSGVVAVLEEEGANPIANQATDAFSPLEAELAHQHPHRSENSYPNAYDQIVQLFDAPAAPDLCVLHSARHNWEDQGGHIGEHGSLGVVQARAPWVLAGKGVANLGVVPRAARLVDVAPTIAALLGCAPVAADNGRYLSRQDGVVRDDVLDPSERARHVVGFLFDGANPNVLYSMAASGEAPNVARLIEMGTAFGHGAMAGLPTVTLANHTSIITGAYPGHHGILNNAWYDRATQQQVITNSPLPGTSRWTTSTRAPTRFTPQCCAPGPTSSPHRSTNRATSTRPTPPSVFFRRGENPGIPPSADGLPHVTERFVRPSKDYSWSSVVDHMAIEQAVGIWDGHYRDESYPHPRFMWVNFTLTDAAMHECGPHSEMAAASVRDSDARIGEVLAAVERAGAFDDTAFVLVADHGMEENDPSCQGRLGTVSLRNAGLQIRDEAYGFLYLGVDS